MVNIQKQKVVIIGHSTTLRLGTIRAVAELGCEISVVVIIGGKRGGLKPFDCYSRYLSCVFFCHNSEKELTTLLIDKCKDNEQKVLLIPVSDFAAVVIGDNNDILSEYFLFPHIKDPSKSIRYWMDKENQKELARNFGINVPESKVINIFNKSFEIPEGINYPCFTKPLSSIGCGKRYFRRCNNEKELNKVLQSFGTEANVTILVEDYKEIEKEFAVIGFSDGEDVVFPGIIHLLTQTRAALHLGVAMTGEIIPTEGFESLLEQFKIFVLQMGFVGIFDIDFYYSDNKFYFGEMNLRPGASGYAITKLGVNLPAMLVHHLRKESIVGMKRQINRSASFVNERICEDEWNMGGFTSAQYHQTISSADISFVYDSKDSMPQKIFNLLHWRKVIKKFLKGSC